MPEPKYPETLFVVMMRDPLGGIYYDAFPSEDVGNEVAGGEIVGMYRFERRYRAAVILEETHEPGEEPDVPF